ncbi:MAG TPA: PAS domain-containing protein [Chryseosolibacter sp.]
MPPKGRKIPKRTSAKKSIARPKGRVKAADRTINASKLAALRESARQLEIILTTAPIGIWEWNIETNSVAWSGKVFEIFQLPAKTFEKSYETYQSLMHPDDRPKMQRHLQASLASNKKDYFIEHRIIRPDGEERWLLVEAVIVRNAKGVPVKMSGTVQDITERKRIEDDREDWKARHELVSTAAGLVIYDYDIPSGNILWSGNIRDVLGYTPSELGDVDRWVEMIHPEDRAEAFSLLEKAKSENKPYDVYYRFSKNDGAYCYMHDRGVFLPGRTGEPHRMLGMMNDVSERVRAEESLRESEHRFRILQQASFGGIGLHDKGKILDCNQGLCDITGYRYDELIGSNGLDLIAPEWRDFVLDKILSGYDKTYDVEGIRKDGSRYFLEIRGKNLPMEGKTIRVTEFRDITDRKVSEEKIAEQNRKLFAVTDELRRKNHQLQEFTQIVSHNLRSPVGNILTLLTFYDNASSEEEKRELIALLKESGATTLMMLDELNDVLKIKQDKNIPQQEIVFEKMVHQVTSMLTARITEVKAQITFDFSGAPAIHYPGIYLESILLNLLDNALKYHSPERRPEIFLRTYKDENGHIILSVKDNGLGINLERYGHQVFKLRKTFHHHPESRGIGLFMIKNQIEAMGGTIRVESIENEGTCFFVNFNKPHNDGR